MKSEAIFFALLTLMIPVYLTAGDTPNEEESFLLSFVPGDYAVVGKSPDKGSCYSGVARIERKGSRLVLLRQIGSKLIIAEGGVEVPHPPGEGEVLRFRWHEKEPMVMTCLVGGDLDNYARLTCYWVSENGKHMEPGLEALFPTETWPDAAPSKGIQPPR